MFSRRSRLIRRTKKFPSKQFRPKKYTSTKGARVRGGFAAPVAMAGGRVASAFMRSIDRRTGNKLDTIIKGVEDAIDNHADKLVGGVFSTAEKIIRGRTKRPIKKGTAMAASSVEHHMGFSPMHIAKGETKISSYSPVGASQQYPSKIIKHVLRHGVTSKMKAIKKLYKPQKAYSMVYTPPECSIPQEVGYNQVGIWAPFLTYNYALAQDWGTLVSSAFTDSALQQSYFQRYSYPLTWTHLDTQQAVAAVLDASTLVDGDLPSIVNGSVDWRIPITSRHLKFDLYNANLYIPQKIKIYRLISKGVRSGSKFESTETFEPYGYPEYISQSPVNDYLSCLTLTDGSGIGQQSGKLAQEFTPFQRYNTDSFFTDGLTPIESPNMAGSGSTIPFIETSVYPDAASPKLSGEFKETWKIAGVDTCILQPGQVLKYHMEQVMPTMFSAQSFNNNYNDGILVEEGAFSLMIEFESVSGGLIDVWDGGNTTQSATYSIEVEKTPCRIRVSNVEKYAMVSCKGSIAPLLGTLLLAEGNPPGSDVDFTQFYESTYPAVNNAFQVASYQQLNPSTTAIPSSYRVILTSDQNIVFAGPRSTAFDG